MTVRSAIEDRVSALSAAPDEALRVSLATNLNRDSRGWRSATMTPTSPTPMS